MLLNSGEIGDPLRSPFPFLARTVRAACAALAVLLYHRHFQPRLDESEHPPVAHTPRHALHQLSVRYLAEIVGEVRIDHLMVAPVQQPMDPPHRVLRASSRPVRVLLRLQVRLEYRLQHQHRRRLRNPIPQARYAQGTELPRLLLRNEHLTHRFRLRRCHPSGPATVPRPTDSTPCASTSATVTPSTPAAPPLRRTSPPRLQEEIQPPHLVD